MTNEMLLILTIFLIYGSILIWFYLFGKSGLFCFAVFASIAVYAICQKFDVWAYHKWWALTERLCGDRDRFLWVRNNGSTLVSQLLNTVLFTFAAFYGVYDLSSLMSIIWASYISFIVTSLLDTPAIYLAKWIYTKKAPTT